MSATGVISASPEVIQVYQNARLSTQAISFLFSPAFSDALQEHAAHVRVVYNVATEKVIEEFRRLLAIKTFTSDVDATKISPTPLMDELWHAAILDTQFYANLQLALGLTLHHRPAGALAHESEQREGRLCAMETLYRMFFHSDPLQGANLPMNHAQSEGLLGNGTQFHSSVSPHGTIHVIISALDGRDHYATFPINADTTVGQLQDAIQGATDIHPKQQKLRFAGSPLDDGATLKDFGVGDQAVVHLTLNLKDADFIPAKFNYSSQELEDGITVTTMTLTGKRTKFRVLVDSTIYALKELFQDKEGIPPDQGIVIFAGKILEDKCTFRESHIPNDSVLHWVLTLRGC